MSNLRSILTAINYYVIEVNPRVSRSSALASKATGYPIAKTCRQDRGRLTLDEIVNPVTGRHTLASSRHWIMSCRRFRVGRSINSVRESEFGHADESDRRSDGHRPYFEESGC